MHLFSCRCSSNSSNVSSLTCFAPTLSKHVWEAAAAAADLGATLRKSEVDVQRSVTNTPNGWVRYDDLMTDFNAFEMFQKFEFY